VPASYLLLLAPVLLFSIVAHEYAHGYAALKQGDPTAYQLGRLTWNPIKHIDPVMSIIVPLVMYLAHLPVLAGAKPVPVNPRNYRNYKRGDIIVSLAGITTNIAIALACTLMVALLGSLGRAIPVLGDTLGILQAMFLLGVYLNLLLAVFNLLPIPPLDGSHVIKYLLPPAWALQYQRIGLFGILIVLLLLQTRFLSYWLFPATYASVVLRGMVSPLVLPSAMQWLPWWAP
jgi:Zn-dependent protease